MTLPLSKVLSQVPAMTPFVGPETIERKRGRPFRLRLGANESAFGVSPQNGEHGGQVSANDPLSIRMSHHDTAGVTQSQGANRALLALEHGGNGLGPFDSMAHAEKGVFKAQALVDAVFHKVRDDLGVGL